MEKISKEKKSTAPAKRKTKEQRLKMKKKTLIIVGSSVAAALVLLTVVGIVIWNHWLDQKLDKINVVTKETDLVFETEVITSEGGGESVVEDPEHNGELNGDNLPLICNTKYVKNYLLLAVDSRGKEAGLSDSMIMVSVNTKTNKIVLCSFMRDILAKYPMEPSSPVAGKYDKMNHAHSYGGPELTMAVLKETFNIEISQYAKINFSAFRNIVDAMGGLDMQLSAAEAQAINSILAETMQEPANDVLKVTYKDMLQIKGNGVYHLTGVQALSHARNRRVGSDYARTQRQRDLIQAMAKKATTLSLSQLNSLLDKVLPLVTTNIPKDTLKELVGDLPSYLTYEIQSTRVPADGMFTEKNYNLIPDLEKNCFALYELVYGEKAPGAPSGNKPLSTNRYPTGGGSAPQTTTTTSTSTTTESVTTTTTPEKTENETKEDEKPEVTEKPETPETSTTKPGESTTTTTTTKPAEQTTTTTTTTKAPEQGDDDNDHN